MAQVPGQGHLGQALSRASAMVCGALMAVTVASSIWSSCRWPGPGGTAIGGNAVYIFLVRRPAPGEGDAARAVLLQHGHEALQNPAIEHIIRWLMNKAGNAFGLENADASSAYSVR